MTLDCLAGAEIIDLTHPLALDNPLWPGDPATEFSSWATRAQDGYYLRKLALGEHTGTHLGTGSHIDPAGMTADRLPAGQLVRPCICLDIRRRVQANPDAVLRLTDVQEFERAHGQIPTDWVVLLCTGWSTRWPNAAAYFNRDAEGIMHFPGFGIDAVEFLITHRDVAGLGTDTAGIDPGPDEALSANRLLLREQRYHLENLTNLHQVPSTGAWIVVGALPLAGGSGSPARVLALVP